MTTKHSTRRYRYLEDDLTGALSVAEIQAALQEAAARQHKRNRSWWANLRAWAKQRTAWIGRTPKPVEPRAPRPVSQAVSEQLQWPYNGQQVGSGDGPQP